MSFLVETRIVTADEDGMRLDRWFKTHFPDLAFGHLQKLLRSGQIRVDGARAKTNDRLSKDQNVRVPPLPRSDPAITSVKRSAQSQKDADFIRSLILHEDRDVLVINKPHGLSVQGGSGTERHVDGMLAALAGPDGEKPRLVHRLDRDTSGVLVLAKTRKAASDLGAIFRTRSARKIYWALVKGVPAPKQGRISLFLSKQLGMDGEKVRVMKHGDEEAVHSITYYSLVDRAANSVSWLSLKPVTGRTHQLRAHTAHIGHPIIGDPKYGEAMENIPEELPKKLHLHARRITLPHPRGGTLDVTAPLPPHMKQSFEILGFDASAYDPIVDAPED
ncbi:RluA family pseudouridine synthase [Labrys sp. LIt4]|uniref:Pseudouridine synthase n=1 Tax=Labrys okinawensis TaxID=346911 RepID=A0A2S9QAQ9_9HYPH|nr:MULTISPECIES: RluA family pseudouridine synthase [Labrys]MBP0578677.1 RluA family pseudouridine synthase [Labrys sp. LIt4]PRH86415.1 RluA family pseudouridine synthase [Labrys okinawensis]